MADSSFVYDPPPSLAPFFASNHKLRFIRGPVGSTKSTACVMEMFRRACQQAPDADGVRRTKFAVVRNTLGQIKETCLVTMRKTLGPLIYFKVSENKVILKFNDVESEWLFLPLDTPENVQRLLSLELTGAWVSEFREILPEIVVNVYSRCGRYPAELGQGVNPTWYGLFGETNSFSEDSPWFDELEIPETLEVLIPGKTSLPKPNWFYLVQPGAYDEDADWLQYLPPTYYSDLLESNGKAWAAQYVFNQISASLSSQAVFAKSFDREAHLRSGLKFVHTIPLVIGLDVGRQPAAVFGQIDMRGRLNVLASIWGENIGIELFLQTEVLPLLAGRFPRAYAYAVVDPAARSRSQIGEESVLEAINRCGLSAILAVTNNIAPRLRAVEKYLNRRDGMAIDPDHNARLVVALQYGYRFPRDKEKALRELPDKTHPDSDLCIHIKHLAPTSRGMLRMGELRVGDFVQTPWGLDEVVATCLREAPLVRIELEGDEVFCTPDHLVAVKIADGGRFIRADALQYGDELFFGGEEWGSRKVESIRESERSSDTASIAARSSKLGSGKLTRARASIALLSAAVWRDAARLVSSTTGSGSGRTLATVITGTSCRMLMLPTEFHSTATYGRRQTGLSRTGLSSTISTMIERVRRWRILSLWQSPTMRACTRASVLPRAPWFLRLPVPGLHRRKRGNGTAPRKAEPGTASTLVRQPLLVKSAPQFSIAKDAAGSMSASSAETALSFAPAARSVVSVSCAGSGLVVNLTTRNYRQYFAAGLLNHNCDALQYLCLGVEGRALARQTRRLERQATDFREPTAAGWT